MENDSAVAVIHHMPSFALSGTKRQAQSFQTDNELRARVQVPRERAARVKQMVAAGEKSNE